MSDTEQTADESQKLARADMAAFETQGRFIQSRYGQDALPPTEDAPNN